MPAEQKVGADLPEGTTGEYRRDRLAPDCLFFPAVNGLSEAGNLFHTSIARPLRCIRQACFLFAATAE